MKNESIKLEKTEIIRRLVITVIFSFLSVSLVLCYFFLFLNREDRKVSDNNNICFLVVLFASIFSFALFYILNLFVFRRKMVHVAMSAFEDGLTFFSGVASIIVLLASYEEFSFNKEFVSLYVGSSFSLLGFGLTITAIMTGFFVNKLKKDKKEKQIEEVFAYLLPYFLFFVSGLLWTVSALLEIQFIDKGFYQIIIYQSLFFSATQIFLIIYRVIKETLLSVFA